MWDNLRGNATLLAERVVNVSDHIYATARGARHELYADIPGFTNSLQNLSKPSQQYYRYDDF